MIFRHSCSSREGRYWGIFKMANLCNEIHLRPFQYFQCVKNSLEQRLQSQKCIFLYLLLWKWVFTRNVNKKTLRNVLQFKKCLQHKKKLIFKLRLMVLNVNVNRDMSRSILMPMNFLAKSTIPDVEESRVKLYICMNGQ